MSFSEQIRKITYFTIDRLKGGVVSKAIRELEDFEALGKVEKIDVVTRAWDILKEDIINNVAFYEGMSKQSNILDFSVVNKKKIAKNPALFYNSRFNIEELIAVRTSGSYGTPLTYYLTPFKKKNQLAEVIFYGRKCGYDVGVRHGYFRSEATKSSWKLWMQNESMFASKELDVKFLEVGLSTLKTKKLKTLIGFPSSISYLAKYCIDSGYKSSDFNVTGVITQSENLTKYHRDIMFKAFKCVIHNRYSTEEFGVIANEYTYDKGFEINSFNYIVEVLKLDKDESVEIGELGRIVVTDLHSNAMPLIRYETGDLGIVDKFLCSKNKWVSRLSKLSGRTMQIICSTKGTALYPLYLDSIMESYDCFKQYQLIQSNEKVYDLKLVVNNIFNKESFDFVKFQDTFYKWLGNDAELTFSFVNDIEKLPSGKRPYIINKYKDFSI